MHFIFYIISGDPYIDNETFFKFHHKLLNFGNVENVATNQVPLLIYTLPYHVFEKYFWDGTSLSCPPPSPYRQNDVYVDPLLPLP